MTTSSCRIYIMSEKNIYILSCSEPFTYLPLMITSQVSLPNLIWMNYVVLLHISPEILLQSLPNAIAHLRQWTLEKLRRQLCFFTGNWKVECMSGCASSRSETLTPQQ